MGRRSLRQRLRGEDGRIRPLERDSLAGCRGGESDAVLFEHRLENRNAAVGHQGRLEDQVVHVVGQRHAPSAAGLGHVGKRLVPGGSEHDDQIGLGGPPCRLGVGCREPGGLPADRQER